MNITERRLLSEDLNAALSYALQQDVPEDLIDGLVKQHFWNHSELAESWTIKSVRFDLRFDAWQVVVAPAAIPLQFTFLKEHLNQVVSTDTPDRITP